MTILDPEDEHWAEDFGMRYGASYADVEVSDATMSKDFSNHANDPLNERAVAHGKRVHGIPDSGELTDEQAAGEIPYLQALAQVAGREMQWAMYWRRQLTRGGEDDPGMDYIEIRKRPNMRAILEGWGPSSVGRARVTDNNGLRHDLDIELIRQEMRAEREAARQARESTRNPGNDAPDPEPEDSSAVWAQQLRNLQAQEDARFDDWDDDHEDVSEEEDSAINPRGSAGYTAQLPGASARPSPQPYGVNHEGAERLAADWMRHLGVADAHVTRYSGDGGIDVESEHIVAQVKNIHPSSTVPVSAIRDLFGTATSLGKRAVLFTSGGVTRDGLAFADATGVALVRYMAEDGTIAGMNALGRRVVVAGLPGAFGTDRQLL